MTTNQILKTTRKGRDGRELKCIIRDGYFVLQGGEYGEHHLAIEHTTDARLAAHWDGYCRENGWIPGRNADFYERTVDGERLCFLAVGGNWAKHLKGRS